MHSISLAAIILCLLFVDQAMASSYALSDSIVGPHFFDAFSFQAIEDPTYGTVSVFFSFLLLLFAWFADTIIVCSI
jgi:hypothetical protein